MEPTDCSGLVHTARGFYATIDLFIMAILSGFRVTED